MRSMPAPDLEAVLDLLLPRPHQCRLTGERLALRETLAALAPDAPDPATAAELVRSCAMCLAPVGLEVERVESAAEADLHLLLEPDPGRPQSYSLRVGEQGITVRGTDPAGIFYGLQTLAQWIELGRRGSTLPGLEVEDRPDFRHRGVLLDISRNRVPRMDFLLDLVDRLARFKVNQLQLYTEHTFAYRGHEQVWRDWSPLYPEEVRQLDAFCRERHVELVPNQNSFGHFHRWLVHEPYRRLAECPDGVEHPWSAEPEPFGLCPVDPGSLRLLEELYDQLLPNFTSRQFNVGLDETLDLGRGRSAAACRARGSTTVYLDFLAEIHRRVSQRGFRMQFWGDIIVQAPERIAELPDDVVALEWGYEADHPFEEHSRAFARSGRDFYVCPGTSSWNSLAGRWDNAVANVEAAARWGHAAGACGLLITDWGDSGHLQPPPVSELGLLLGADRGWNAESRRDRPEEPLARLVFERQHPGSGERLARAAHRLGNVYRLTGAPARHASPLFRLLSHSDQDLDHPRFRGLSRAGLHAALDAIPEATAELPEAPLAARELRWAGDLLALAARLGLARLEAGHETPVGRLPESARVPLARELERLAAELGPLWLERSRPGGLEASRALLRRWRARLGA